MIFFTGAELDPPPGHVGIVVAPGVMIDAPHTGSVVQEVNFGTNGTGVNEFMGYGRVPGLAGNASTANQALITKRGPGSQVDNEVGKAIGTVVSYGIMAVVILLVVIVLVALVIHFK